MPGWDSRALKTRCIIAGNWHNWLRCRQQRSSLFSTGIIGQPLPLEKITAALPTLLETVREDAWLSVANAIMTTDTVAKWCSQRVHCNGVEITITGIAKGAGMICPNMATMLAFVATDMGIDSDTTQQVLTEACATSFNAITVDGDTSTNDAAVLIASAESGVDFNTLNDEDKETFVRP